MVTSPGESILNHARGWDPPCPPWLKSNLWGDFRPRQRPGPLNVLLVGSSSLWAWSVCPPLSPPGALLPPILLGSVTKLSSAPCSVAVVLIAVLMPQLSLFWLRTGTRFLRVSFL